MYVGVLKNHRENSDPQEGGKRCGLQYGMSNECERKAVLKW